MERSDKPNSKAPRNGNNNSFPEGDAPHIDHAVSYQAVLAYRRRIEEIVRSGRADGRALDMFSKVGKHMMDSPSAWNDPSTAGREGD